MNSKLKEYEEHLLKRRKPSKLKKPNSRKVLGYRRNNKLKETRDIYHAKDYLSNWNQKMQQGSFKGVDGTQTLGSKMTALEYRAIRK